MDIDIVTTTARIAHEANRVWCVENGDHSKPVWADAPDWQRESAISGVVFHAENPSASDSASHDNWMAEKVAAGWIYGEVKDPDATPPTHPCIVPFQELPKFQQKKNALFRSIVHATLGLASHSGLPVKGYQEQSAYNVQMVNHNKTHEEVILRVMDAMSNIDEIDKRWLSIARTHIEQGFMALNRSIFKPERIDLPEEASEEDDLNWKT